MGASGGRAGRRKCSERGKSNGSDYYVSLVRKSSHTTLASPSVKQGRRQKMEATYLFTPSGEMEVRK